MKNKKTKKSKTHPKPKAKPVFRTRPLASKANANPKTYAEIGSADLDVTAIVQGGTIQAPRKKRKTARQRRIEAAAELSLVRSKKSEAEKAQNAAERALSAVNGALAAQLLAARNAVLSETVSLMLTPRSEDRQRVAEQAWRDYATVFNICRKAIGAQAADGLLAEDAGEALDMAFADCLERGDADTDGSGDDE